MNRAIFITVRTGSSRLPQKALKEICGAPAIVQLIRRVRHSVMAEGIVLCTTELPEDDILVEIAKNEEIGFFRGSVKDKLIRWHGAASQFKVEFFVTADGDDLLCEPELIDLAFRQYERESPDFIEGTGLVCGSFTYGIKASALSKVCEIKDSEDTEMMWVYFKDTGLFECAELKDVPDIFKRPEIRMTLDYEDDLRFFRTIFNHFKGGYAGLREVIEYLDQHPDVIKINQYLQERFLENQKKRTTLILKRK
ncbi:MAG: hypothetical protein AB1650_07495 [Candidatus Omnitrophota bacterium]